MPRGSLVKHALPSCPVIPALDLSSEEEALELVRALSPPCEIFKIGLRLFCRGGPDFVRRLAGETGAKIFLDLKLHDIPRTVATAVRELRSLNVTFVTVHISGGREMIRAAVEAAEEGMAVLGVTVLTSLSAEASQKIFGVSEPESAVLRFARWAVEERLAGVVASPLEVAPIRERFSREELLVVTPGIRLSEKERRGDDDQARAATPRKAFSEGADYLVVGRPLYESKKPREVLEEILSEYEELRR
ncbi:MAG: orotidine-5'-phosphate decarboxylase [Candidatus Hydrogenedentota bacterium]|nr:MAG: orotidine-5'-phosphate decarboxylase [Candidatus Hydrogenedentota bacterium]